MSRTLAVIVACSLAGCGGKSSGDAAHAKLDPARATALELGAVGGATTFCPNAAPLQLHAVVTADGGKRLETWVAGESQDGRLGFDAFAFTASAGSVDAEGRLALPADPFALIDRDLVITATVAGRPGAPIEAKLTLKPVWTCGGRVETGGAAGAAGRDGGDGVPGRDGRSADAVTKAENGEPGEVGANATAGGAGGPGIALDVALGVIASTSHGQLVLVRIGQGSFLFDPAGGPFTVVASGGKGGAGGKGGSGGKGGDGGDTSASDGLGGNGADGGNGGNGGAAGDGGAGGALRVQYDSRHPELLQAVKLDNSGGAGGERGAGGGGGAGGRGGVSITGQRGTDGRKGRPGQRGAAGNAGPNGPEVAASPADAAALFAGEIQRGVTISPQ